MKDNEKKKNKRLFLPAINNKANSQIKLTPITAENFKEFYESFKKKFEKNN